MSKPTPKYTDEEFRIIVSTINWYLFAPARKIRKIGTLKQIIDAHLDAYRTYQEESAAQEVHS